jgi:hypothetical protein
MKKIKCCDCGPRFVLLAIDVDADWIEQVSFNIGHVPFIDKQLS